MSNLLTLPIGAAQDSFLFCVGILTVIWVTVVIAVKSLAGARADESRA